MMRPSRRTRTCCAPTRTAASASSPIRPAASSSPTPTISATGSQRIDTDMRNYYVLTYVPKNPVFDGKFRTIDVKVKRPGARIALAQGLLRRAHAVRRAGARLRGAGAGRARSPAAAERVPGAGAVAALSRAPIGPGWRRCSSRVPTSRRDVPAIAGAEAPTTSDFIVLARIKDSSGTGASRRCQPALPAAGPDRPAGQHQDGRGALLPRAGPRARASTRSRRSSTTRWPTRPRCASRPSTSPRPSRRPCA